MEEVDLWEANILASVIFEVDCLGRCVNVKMRALWKDEFCLTVVEDKCWTLNNGAERRPREHFIRKWNHWNEQ